MIASLTTPFKCCIAYVYEITSFLFFFFLCVGEVITIHVSVTYSHVRSIHLRHINKHYIYVHFTSIIQFKRSAVCYTYEPGSIEIGIIHQKNDGLPHRIIYANAIPKHKKKPWDVCALLHNDSLTLEYHFILHFSQKPLFAVCHGWKIHRIRCQEMKKKTVVATCDIPNVRQIQFGDDPERRVTLRNGQSQLNNNLICVSPSSRPLIICVQPPLSTACTVSASSVTR